MKSTSIGMILVAALSGCTIGGDGQPLDYEEFKARYIGETDGRFYYDWDVVFESEAQVEGLYAEYVRAQTGGERTSEAIVNVNVFSDRDVWTAAQAKDLSYCVSDTFGANKQAVVTAMAQATSAWDAASGGHVKFVHQAQYDANCSENTQEVVFDVRPGQFAYAVAFFPSFARNQRSVLIHPDTFNGDFPPEGILRHELGHTLGLRHETTRIDALVEYGVQCFEDIFFEELTPYDNQSVMTTPACMGDQLKNKTLSLTQMDIAGIQKLY
jgi:serralysin